MTSYKHTPSDHYCSLQSTDHLLVTDFSEHGHLPTGLTKLCSYVSDRKDQHAPSGVLLPLPGSHTLLADADVEHPRARAVSWRHAEPGVVGVNCRVGKHHGRGHKAVGWDACNAS